jgi:hypothetical protein
VWRKSDPGGLKKGFSNYGDNDCREVGNYPGAQAGILLLFLNHYRPSFTNPKVNIFPKGD